MQTVKTIHYILKHKISHRNYTSQNDMENSRGTSLTAFRIMREANPRKHYGNM